MPSLYPDDLDPNHPNITGAYEGDVEDVEPDLDALYDSEVDRQIDAALGK